MSKYQPKVEFKFDNVAFRLLLDVTLCQCEGVQWLEDNAEASFILLPSTRRVQTWRLMPDCKLWPASHSCVDADAVPGGAQILPLLHIHTCASVANETASWNWLADLPRVNPARPARVEMEHLDQCKGGPVTSSFNVRHPHTLTLMADPVTT